MATPTKKESTADHFLTFFKWGLLPGYIPWRIFKATVGAGVSHVYDKMTAGRTLAKSEFNDEVMGNHLNEFNKMIASKLKNSDIFKPDKEGQSPNIRQMIGTLQIKAELLERQDKPLNQADQTKLDQIREDITKLGKVKESNFQHFLVLGQLALMTKDKERQAEVEQYFESILKKNDDDNIKIKEVDGEANLPSGGKFKVYQDEQGHKVYGVELSSKIGHLPPEQRAEVFSRDIKATVLHAIGAGENPPIRISFSCDSTEEAKYAQAAIQGALDAGIPLENIHININGKGFGAGKVPENSKIPSAASLYNENKDFPVSTQKFEHFKAIFKRSLGDEPPAPAKASTVSVDSPALDNTKLQAPRSSDLENSHRAGMRN